MIPLAVGTYRLGYSSGIVPFRLGPKIVDWVAIRNTIIIISGQEPSIIPAAPQSIAATSNALAKITTLRLENLSAIHPAYAAKRMNGTANREFIIPFLVVLPAASIITDILKKLSLNTPRK